MERTSLTCALNSLISKAQDGKVKCDAPQPAEMYKKKEKPLSPASSNAQDEFGERAILPDIEDGKRAKKCLRHWAPQSREFSCSTAPRMQQMVASSLPPQHSAQDSLLACFSSKKIVEIDNGLQIAQITATGLGRLLSSPCPGVLGKVGGWVAMVWWITQEKEKSLRNWHLGVHRTPRRREPLLRYCPGSIPRPIPHPWDFTFPISLWNYSFF